MKKAFRITGWILVTLALIVIALLSFIHVRSNQILATEYQVPLVPVQPGHDSVTLARGHHLTQIYHCASCHGDQLQGKTFLTIPGVATIYASNVPSRIEGYSDAELARLIRHAVRKDGTAAWMPASINYHQMTDQDVSDLIAWLRTLPVTEDTVPPHDLRLLARIGLVTGQFKPYPREIDHTAPRTYQHSDTSRIALGRYLATTVCGGCHGQDLKGVTNPDMKTPDLVIAASYKRDQFHTLLKTGLTPDGRGAPTMSEMCRTYFSEFTTAEVDGLHAFLSTLPEGK